MTKNRVQCSLIFTDDDIFGNLVLPLKESREFSDFLIKLCTRYYESEEIRSLIDSADDEVVVEENEQRNNMYTQIGESLAVIDFLVSEGEQIVGDGADVFDNIVAGAEETGIFVQNTDDSLGRGVSTVDRAKVNPKLLELAKQGKESNDTTEESLKIEKLENELNTMKDMFISMQETLNSLVSQGIVNKGQNQMSQQNVEVNSQSSVVDDGAIELDFDSDFDNSDEAVYTPEDSTDSINDLLSSL